MSIGLNTHICISCGFIPKAGYDRNFCPICNGELHGMSPAITGTRDSFGVGKNFIHENEDGTLKEITNWKEWEKAGYRDALSCHKGDVKEKIKEKMSKIRHEKKQRITVGG